MRKRRTIIRILAVLGTIAAVFTRGFAILLIAVVQHDGFGIPQDCGYVDHVFTGYVYRSYSEPVPNAVVHIESAFVGPCLSSGTIEPIMAVTDEQGRFSTNASVFMREDEWVNLTVIALGCREYHDDGIYPGILYEPLLGERNSDFRYTVRLMCD